MFQLMLVLTLGQSSRLFHSTCCFQPQWAYFWLHIFHPTFLHAVLFTWDPNSISAAVFCRLDFVYLRLGTTGGLHSAASSPVCEISHLWIVTFVPSWEDRCYIKVALLSLWSLGETKMIVFQSTAWLTTIWRSRNISYYCLCQIGERFAVAAFHDAFMLLVQLWKTSFLFLWKGWEKVLQRYTSNL